MLKNIMTILIVAVLASCTTTAPVIDFDPSVDFSKYKTFAFIDEHPLIRAEGAKVGSPLLEGRLMELTERALNAKGFERIAKAESADVAIAFTVGARDKTLVNSYPASYQTYYGGGFRSGWGLPYYGGGLAGPTSVEQYTEGTLAIDVYDISTYQPVWHGKATKKITKRMQENPQETVTEIVNNILTGFPPM